MNFLEKIKNSSERKKKFIFWAIIIVLILIFSFFWVQDVKRNIKKLKEENFTNLFNNQEKADEMKKQAENIKKEISNISNIKNKISQDLEKNLKDEDLKELKKILENQ
ncbi:MAG TPA: hypothetical protein PK121_02600 [Candidatus Pacearchaeota archaeon]|nr:hypothetical protein [Candidatus Pacearchaeota archaeon]